MNEAPEITSEDRDQIGTYTGTDPTLADITTVEREWEGLEETSG